MTKTYTAKMIYRGQVFESTSASAFDALEQNLRKFAERNGMTILDAGDELAFAEQRGTLVDDLYLDGVKVDIESHL